MLDVAIWKQWKTPGRSTFDLAVQFRVPTGLTVLFGPSGCGKTSTLQAIAGLLRPDAGHITVQGTPFFAGDRALHLPPHRRRVGYVFQNYALFPHLNVADNIGFALYRWPKSQRQQRIRELADLLALEDLLPCPIRHISGGQAQRVAIARAIAPCPQLLLMDEPFGALDDDLRTTLQQELKALQRRLNLPILLVTHSRSEAITLADHLVRLEAGRVVAVGAAHELLEARSPQATQTSAPPLPTDCGPARPDPAPGTTDDASASPCT